MTWPIPLIAAAAAVAALLISKPERRRWASVASVLILVAGLWQAGAELLAKRAQAAIADRAIYELRLAHSRFSSMMAEMIHQSSDGWLPGSADEFYSAQAAQLVCRHLDLARQAPIRPEREWWHWIASNTQEFQRALQDIIKYRAQDLPPDLFREVSALESSALFRWWTAPAAINANRDYLGIDRQHQLCNGVEEQIAEAFEHMRRIDALTSGLPAAAKLKGEPPWARLTREDYKRSSGAARWEPATQ